MSTDDHPQGTRQRDIDRRSRWVGFGIAGVVLVGLVAAFVVFAGLATTAAVVGAGSAAVAAYSARQSLRRLVEDSNRRTRPYVYLYLAPGLERNGTYDLVVENTGESMAYDVTLDFVAGPDDDLPDLDHPGIVKMLKDNVIGVGFDLPPRGRHRFIWHAGDVNPEFSGMPDKTPVTVHYRATAAPVKNELLTSRFVLSTAIFEASSKPRSPEMVISPSSSDMQRHEVKLGNINESLRAIAFHLGEQRR